MSGWAGMLSLHHSAKTVDHYAYGLSWPCKRERRLNTWRFPYSCTPGNILGNAYPLSSPELTPMLSRWYIAPLFDRRSGRNFASDHPSNRWPEYVLAIGLVGYFPRRIWIGRLSLRPSNTWFLGPARVLNPNVISIGWAVFARRTTVTDRQTDHTTRSVT